MTNIVHIQNQKVHSTVRYGENPLPGHQGSYTAEVFLPDITKIIRQAVKSLGQTTVFWLAGSLNSGRLYSQATAMTRFYAKPMLLIGMQKQFRT
jgi:hypothetical protein